MSDIDQFKKLPKEIKNWLASENLAYAISEITDRIGLSEKKSAAISRLIFLLVTQQIEPKDFISYLGHDLDTSFETAKAIAGDIERNALHPMAVELRRELNLDTKAIYFGQPGESKRIGSTINQPDPVAIPSPIESLKKTGIPRNSSQGPVVNLQSFSIKSDRPISPLNFTSTIKKANSTAEEIKKSQTQESIATPFILHQENPTSAPTINQKPHEFQSAKSSLTMKVQDYYQNSSSAERSIPKPISIKIEVPTSEIISKKESQSIQVNTQSTLPEPKTEIPLPNAVSNQNSRIVHYSNLRTPLNNLGIPKNIIEKDNVLDLRAKK